MQKTANTLSKNIRAKSVAVLNRHLAATIDLHAQVKQAHWNVRGPTFIAIHELFDKVADAVEGHSDTIAERAGTWRDRGRNRPDRRRAFVSGAVPARHR